MPIIQYCYRCQQPHRELTLCHSVNNYLCEECIVILAHRYFEENFTVARSAAPSIAPETSDESPA